MNATIPQGGSPYQFIINHDSYFVTITTLSINMVLGLPLNCYIAWLILRSSGETIASDFFSLNLSLSEILFALSGTIYMFFKKLKQLSILKAFMFSLGFIFTARPLFQCCICVEFYIGVIHPVSYLRFKPLRYRVACCCAAWLLILLSCIYNFYTFYEPKCMYGYFSQTVLLFSVMLFCCLSVLWALKRPGPGDGDTGKRSSNAMKRRAFKIILIIMTFMAINFLFYIAAIPLQCCLDRPDFYKILDICFGIDLTTGFIQPLLYLHRSGKLCVYGRPN